MMRVVILLAVSSCLLPAAALGQEALPKTAPKQQETTLPWFTSLLEGKIHAQRHQQPMLVRFASSGCPWCEKLEEALRQVDLQKELGRKAHEHRLLMALGVDLAFEQ